MKIFSSYFSLSFLSSFVIFLFIFFFNFFENKNAFAQETLPKKDTKNQKNPKNGTKKDAKKDSIITISKKLRFAPPRIGINIISPIVWSVDSRFQQIEFCAEIPINPRYWIMIDAGQSTILRDANRQNGAYMRVGAVYNSWFEDKSKHGGLLGVGIQYGKSFFSQEISQTFQNANFPALTLTQKYTNLTADWVEICGILEAKISKRIYLSPIVRLKFLVNVSQRNQVIDIAGFGNNNITKLEAGFRVFWQF
jgi:hypothetical protein